MNASAQTVSSQPSAPRRVWCAEWLAGWNAFWFTPADPLPLAIVRIATGALLAWSAAVWLLDAPAFFGPDAWLTAHDVWRMNDQPWQWSWYFSVATPAAARLLTVALLVAAVCLMLGLATPLAALVSLAGLVSAANRAPLNTFGLDDTLGMLLVPLLVGPSGGVLSLDAALGRGDSRPSARANIALRLLQVHLCVVYLFSGCGKLL
ncbi:MAG: hypothetical protein ACKOBP_07505, partial [Planctomycetia bacterium]